MLLLRTHPSVPRQFIWAARTYVTVGGSRIRPRRVWPWLFALRRSGFVSGDGRISLDFLDWGAALGQAKCVGHKTDTVIDGNGGNCTKNDSVGQDADERNA